ncbi:MAG: hypothetical protein QMD71_01455 [bacterium]|nr:hypothetical protein [bacterium]
MDTARCEIIVNGALLAVGIESDSITFSSASDVPYPEDWYGIKGLIFYLTS